MNQKIWNSLFAVLSLIFCIKGLGGSFNALFTILGWDFFHGPAIGACLGLSLTGFFLTFSEDNFVSYPLTKKDRLLTCVLFLIPLVLALFQRVLLIQNTPLDINRADMLFAIQSEINALLSGNNPYGPVLMADGREVLHGYPTLLWLSYLPLSVLRLDLRYLNVFAQVIFYLFLLNLFLKKQTYWFKNNYLNIAAFLSLFLLHLFSKQATRQPLDVHTGPYWLYWTVFLWLVSANQLKKSFWLIPLLLLCREPAILLLLPMAIVIFKNQRALFWNALIKTIGVGLLIAGPFIVWDPFLYFKGIKFYAHHIYENPAEIALRFYGFSGLLISTNTIWLQKLIQSIGLVIALFVLGKKKASLSLSESLALGGLSYLWLMLCVSLSYPFIYTELIILFYALLLWPASQRSTQLS